MKVLPVLVRLAQAGHPHAVNSLLSILGEQTELRLLRTTRDANVADESSQAARIAIWRRLQSLDASRNVGGYAHLTAKHEVAHAFRGGTRTRSLDDLLEQEEGNHEPAGPGPSPLESLIRGEEQDAQSRLFGGDSARLFASGESGELLSEHDPAAQVTPWDLLPEIRAWLTTLPARKRRLLHLRFVDDLSLAEIAAQLGEPEGTTRASLTRMLQSIRRKLGLPRQLSEIRTARSKSRLVA